MTTNTYTGWQDQIVKARRPETHACWADPATDPENQYPGTSAACNQAGIPPLYLCPHHHAQIVPTEEPVSPRGNHQPN